MKTKLSIRYLIMLVALVTGLIFSCKKEQSPDEPVAAANPEVTGIQPKNPQPGDVVTITGANFGTTAADVKLTVGSTTLYISSITATEIKFTVPQNLSSGALALTIKGVAAAIKDAQGANITVTPKQTPVPTFTAMSPTSGKPGDIVTFTGTNFNPQASENKVFFATTTGGTVVLATVKSATATTLTVEVPGTAVTGGVLVTVSGTNAVTPAGFTPTFTVNSTGGTGGGDVTYLQVVTGNLTFNKVGTAANEIGTMWFDKVKNMIYYSDYTVLTQTGSKLYKLDPAGNTPPQALTADARITNIVKVATDAEGNVYVLKYEDEPNLLSLYKITADGGTVTEVKSKFNTGGRYFLFVNANNEACIRPNLRIKQNGDLITTGANLPGLQQTTEGAVFNSSTAYVAYTTDNSGYSSNCVFAKWNLNDGTSTNASFTLPSLFSDDPDRVSSNRQITSFRYAVDDNENIYAMIDKSTSVSANKTWVIRKAKNGVSGYTHVGSFYTKVLTADLNNVTGSVMLVSDARGNLYIKANMKDIVRISF